MSLKLEVERLAHLCNIPSPEKIKQQLVHYDTTGSPSKTHKLFSPKKHNPSPINSIEHGKKQKNGADKALERKLEKFNKPKVTEKVITPGFILRKTPAKVEVTLTDDFWKREEYYKRLADEEERRKAPDQRDAIIEYLQEQLQHMALQHENERVQYKSSLSKLTRDGTFQLQELQDQHEEHIKAIEEDQHIEMQRLKTSHQMEVEDLVYLHEREKLNSQENMREMNESIDKLQQRMQEEMEKGLNKKETEMNRIMEQKIKDALEEQKKVLIAEKNDELDQMVKETGIQTQKILEQHHKEMQILLRKFAASASDADKLKQTMFEVEALRDENVTLKEDYKVTSERLKKTENELADVKIKLSSYELQFEEKVAEVDELYSKKINNLMQESSDLRRKYMKKCEELHFLKKEQNDKQVNAAATAKELMKSIIRSRARTDVSLISSQNENPDLQSEQSRHINRQTNLQRRSSAPITRQEFDSTFISSEVKVVEKPPSPPLIKQSLAQHRKSRGSIQASRIRLPELEYKS